jgi:hypothetical protein
MLPLLDFRKSIARVTKRWFGAGLNTRWSEQGEQKEAKMASAYSALTINHWPLFGR